MDYDTTAGGKEGLNKLVDARQKGEPFDLVLLDMDMPGMGGLEVARKIKADPTMADVRMVMLTSVGVHGDARAAKKNGISAYLTKPIRQSELYNSLLKVVGDNRGKGSERPASRRSTGKEGPRFDVHVLIAEDNATNREVTEAMLGAFGCRVSLAVNGREAVDAVARSGEEYDLIFMDCQMPVLDGYQATAAIRGLEQGKGLKRRIPIVALTAHALEEDRDKCLSAGMDDYLSKPFVLSQLQAVLERWFEGGTGKQTAGKAEPEGEEEHSSSPIDRSVLCALQDLQIRGEPSVVKRVIDAYLADSEPLVSRLQEALLVNDGEVLQRSAHSLKSSSANVGALGLSEISRELEMECKNNGAEDAPRLVAAIESEFMRVKEALQRENDLI